MTKINDPVGVLNLIKKVSEQLKKSRSLEEAAQSFNSLLYGEFQDSVVLTRTFVTVPFRELPLENRQFVERLAEGAHVANLLSDNTLVLTLMGTMGADTAWNSRKSSKGHVGIPLVSSAFIEEIPMMSRLLNELGLDLSWIDRTDSEIVSDAFGKPGGVFYVDDAKTTVDKRNRKIIAAQDFVTKHDVKTVFGLGSGYVQTPTFAVNINFLRDTADKATVEKFVPVFNQFRIDTFDLVWGKQIFA